MPDLSSNNRKQLLALARQAIRTYLETGMNLDRNVSLPDPWGRGGDEALEKFCAGCFVTLRKKGTLRGCIGTFDSARPLLDNVVRMAIAAAAQDTRFPPLTQSELREVQISLSILGGLERVQCIEEIEIGRHGVYVKHGIRSGTFLPEVAVEQKWSREEFVVFCARQKAGLRPEECAAAEVYRYEVDQFSE